MKSVGNKQTRRPYQRNEFLIVASVILILYGACVILAYLIGGLTFFDVDAALAAIGAFIFVMLWQLLLLTDWSKTGPLRW